jgi:CRP/FNR family transcriptional regulator, cyclic AMP receptor protein
VADTKLSGMLAAVPMFERLSKRQLKAIANASELVEYVAGQPIVREGEPGDSFYVVLHGQAKVSANGRTVHRAMPGDHFGEIALLDGGPRSATVTSETPMTLVRLSRKAFFGRLDRDPEMAIALMGTMARMIRRVDRSLAR